MSQSLFGGAIVIPLGKSFLDASQFRQVPDNQEVFVDTITQQSLIVELLEQVDAQDQDIARFHFQQLSDDNEAAQSSVLYVERFNPQEITPHLPHDTTEVYILHGKQHISKFNEKEDALNTVDIILVVLRLRQVETDCVISINVPTQVAPSSSESAISFVQSNEESVREEIMALLKGFQVKNWDLFG
ncbi:hypothetical protein G6F62_013039 [Rhizopus arrhizus]|nr:hypothetical protein G6F62_013039 [Rhizopus arrhizus]KAG1384698.1 hypothetical protein G6F61_000227 [Rhizopus arrhizus]